MENGVTLITATGHRPEAFALCKEYVWRQTYSGPLQWVIVDDGHPPMPFNPEIFEGRGMSVTRLFPLPSWMPGQNTQPRNILAALPAVQYDRIFFIEDDDWYAPDYIENQLAHMGDALIVGETHAVYYNMECQLCARLNNTEHASLCQTGIHASVLPLLKEVCRIPSAIDMRLWAKLKPQGVLYESHRCVGMKGLPGRVGLASGHRAIGRAGWSYDAEWRFLNSLIGDDYLHYKALSTKEKDGDFEIFFWNGQKRYRCNQLWPSGAKCVFDSFDRRALLDHVAQHHTPTPASAPRPRSVSPIVGPHGEEIVHEGDHD